MAQDTREKIIRFYKGTEGEEIAVRLVDLAGQAAKNRKYRLSGFLDPYGQEIAETIAASMEGIHVELDGGYAGAERQRAAFCHEEFAGTPAFEIAVVRAEWKGQFTRLSHRDVLGSLMSLGVERECFGDIIATSDFAKILTDKKMAEYLMENLSRIGEAGVNCTLDELDSIAPREERCKEIRATVASLRVDSIAAAGFGSSRSRAAADIGQDKLKLNWQPVKQASQPVKEGDILSMRGRGRLEVAEIGGQTKKGRTSVVLKRYL